MRIVKKKWKEKKKQSFVNGMIEGLRKNRDRVSLQEFMNFLGYKQFDKALELAMSLNLCITIGGEQI
jgi:predicted lipoprotein